MSAVRQPLLFVVRVVISLSVSLVSASSFCLAVKASCSTSTRLESVVAWYGSPLEHLFAYRSLARIEVTQSCARYERSGSRTAGATASTKSPL